MGLAEEPSVSHTDRFTYSRSTAVSSRFNLITVAKDTSTALRIATEKILLLHRRTSVYEPRPNISPRPPRPRTPSAGRRRLHAPSSAPIRGIRGDTPRPAPEGASGNPRHRRFLPSFCPCGTCWPRGCAVLPGFGPWRGWLLTSDLCRRSHSVNTLHYTSVIGGDSAIVTALTGEDGIPPPPIVGGGMTCVAGCGEGKRWAAGKGSPLFWRDYR